MIHANKAVFCGVSIFEARDSAIHVFALIGVQKASTVPSGMLVWGSAVLYMCYVYLGVFNPPVHA